MRFEKLLLAAAALCLVCMTPACSDDDPATDPEHPFFIFFTVPSSSTIPVNITLHLTLYKKIISYSDYFAVF